MPPPKSLIVGIFFLAYMSPIKKPVFTRADELLKGRFISSFDIYWIPLCSNFCLQTRNIACNNLNMIVSLMECTFWKLPEKSQTKVLIYNLRSAQL